MSRKRITTEQIVHKLRDAYVELAKVCRHIGIIATAEPAMASGGRRSERKALCGRMALHNRLQFRSAPLPPAAYGRLRCLSVQARKCWWWAHVGVGSQRFVGFIRTRSNSRFSYGYWWNGKSQIKALKTTDPGEAKRNQKHDAAGR